MERNNREIKVDEPKLDECKACRIVLLDGESPKGKGEAKDVKVVRFGGPEKVICAEPGKISALGVPQEGGNAFSAKNSAEISTVNVNAVASQKENEGAQKLGRLPSKSSGGVRVIDLDKGPKEEKRKKEKKQCSEEKVSQEKRLRKNLNSSIAEGSFTTASSSIVSSYSTPFALALGATNSEIGLLNSVQNLAGILSQPPGAVLTRRMTRKRIWITCTLLSRFALIPLIFIGLFFTGQAEIWVLIALLGLVSFFSSMRGPAWSSMMGDMVPQERRGRYFGKRNMTIGIAGMVATLAAGAAVYLWGFPVLFAAAVAISFLSILFFMRIREPVLRQERVYHYRFHFSLRDLGCQIKTNKNFAIFTIYMTVVNFGVNIAAPFAAVYMLKDLDVGYGWFAILVTIGALAQILSMRYWGSRCDKYGSRRILFVSGILMCFVPLGYLLSTSIWELVILKVYDGFVWGAFDLVVFNYLLAVTPAERRPGFIANHNFMAGAGTVLGALTGAFLVSHFQPSGFLIFTGLQAVFMVSFALRLCSIVFLPKISDVETTERVPVRYVFWETVAVGPAKGIEHAVTSAFRYPYTVKIKKKLGLETKRKIKINKSRFAGSRK